jgi:hypothetical protein
MDLFICFAKKVSFWGMHYKTFPYSNKLECLSMSATPNLLVGKAGAYPSGVFFSQDSSVRVRLVNNRPG